MIKGGKPMHIFKSQLASAARLHAACFTLLMAMLLLWLSGCAEKEEMQEPPDLTQDRGEWFPSGAFYGALDLFWTPTTDEVIVLTRSGIQAADVDGGTLRSILDRPGLLQAELSVDGQRIYYMHEGEGGFGGNEIWRIGVDGSDDQLLVADVFGPMIVSEDERFLAAVLAGPPDPICFLVNLEEVRARPFEPGLPVAISPDAGEIILLEDQPQRQYVRVNTATREKTALRIDTFYDYLFRWRDGKLQALGNGRIYDIDNKSFRSSDLRGRPNKSWSKSIATSAECLDYYCSLGRIEFYLVNDEPYTSRRFAAALVNRFTYPVFSPNERRAAFLLDEMLYTKDLPF